MYIDLSSCSMYLMPNVVPVSVLCFQRLTTHDHFKLPDADRCVCVGEMADVARWDDAGFGIL